MIQFERAMVVSYRLSVVTIALSLTTLPSNVPDAQINWVGHFWSQFGEEGVDRLMRNCCKLQERRGAVVSKRNHVDIFCRLSTNVTERETDHGTVTSIAIVAIACQQCSLTV